MAEITEDSLFYDYPDGTEESKDGPWKVSEIREWLKEEDKLNSEDAWRVERRGGKDIDEFWDARSAEELVEYWLDDRAGGGCRIEFVDAPHIPDDQELSVEEINAYLEYCDSGIEKDFEDGRDCIQLGGDYYYVDFYGDNLCDIETKKDLFDALFNAYYNFCEDHGISELKAPFVEGLSEREQDTRHALWELTEKFNEKFDKCMAEFHAKKEKQNPKSVVKEALDTAKGDSGKSSVKDIEER